MGTFRSRPKLPRDKVAIGMGARVTMRQYSAATMLFLVSCGISSGQGINSHPSISPSISPPELETCVTPSDQARAVSFASAKGEQVVGAVLGDGSVGIVLSHQVRSDLCEWLPYAKRLRDLGYRALIFDFGTDLVGDVVSAATELRREGANKIVLVGGSMGGTASLVAANAIAPPIAGVASLSGPAIFSGMDAAQASMQLSVPVLFMAAQDDEPRFPTDARALYAECRSSQKQLVILPGSDHGSDLLSGSVADQARGVLEKFISSVSSN